MTKNRNWIESDLTLRGGFTKFEFNYFFSKSLIASMYNTITTKAKCSRSINRRMRKFSITRQRCKSRIDGRARHVDSGAGLSRMPFRFFVGDGYLKGISRRGL